MLGAGHIPDGTSEKCQPSVGLLTRISGQKKKKITESDMPFEFIL